MMRRTVYALALACLAPRIAPAAVPAPAAVLPSDGAIRAILAERVRVLGDGVGIVVGVLDGNGRRVIAAGKTGAGKARPLDGDTVFEIGSVTKVFTALLLADMTRRKEVALADPVNRYLPHAPGMAGAEGRPITLADLATHTSGLPFMPDDLGDLSDATAWKHPVARLDEFLARQEPAGIGERWNYSNLGYWLLGRALAGRAGLTYETLLQRRVVGPLGLRSTGFALTPPLRARLAPGHDATLHPAPALRDVPVFAVMPAAGGLHSTANDLLRLLAVALGRERSPLSLAMADLLSTHRPTGEPGVEQALAWTVRDTDGGALVIHDGGTLGYASAVAWDPRAGIGVVVLSNQVAGVSDIARHLLRPGLPLAPPAAPPVEIALDPATLARYAALYEAPGEGVFTIALEGAFLTFQAPADWGLPKLRLRPESSSDFFASELPLRVTFEAGADGRVSGMLIHPPRGQKAIRAERVVGARAPATGGARLDEKTPGGGIRPTLHAFTAAS